jgi:hypothetical protein
VSALTQEFGVGAHLGDLPGFDHHDPVGALDGRQAVRDHKRGAALHQRVHPFLDEGLGQRFVKVILDCFCHL